MRAFLVNRDQRRAGEEHMPATAECESDGEGGDDGGEGEIQGAVQQALDALVGLDADDLDAAMQEVSHQRIPQRRAC